MAYVEMVTDNGKYDLKPYIEYVVESVGLKQVTTPNQMADWERDEDDWAGEWDVEIDDVLLCVSLRRLPSVVVLSVHEIINDEGVEYTDEEELCRGYVRLEGVTDVGTED